jgi:hypothetical protein
VFLASGDAEDLERKIQRPALPSDQLLPQVLPRHLRVRLRSPESRENENERTSQCPLRVRWHTQTTWRRTAAIERQSIPSMASEKGRKESRRSQDPAETRDTAYSSSHLVAQKFQLLSTNIANTKHFFNQRLDWRSAEAFRSIYIGLSQSSRSSFRQLMQQYHVTSPIEYFLACL